MPNQQGQSRVTWSVLEQDYQGGREQRIAYPYTEEGEFSRVLKRM
jgi:hypothetical protein